jgi:hypothetical protein
MSFGKERCPNMNHGRWNPPVRYCPTCSEVVNARIAIPVCGNEKHARNLRARNTFCADCGERLMLEGG